MLRMILALGARVALPLMTLQPITDGALLAAPRVPLVVLAGLAFGTAAFFVPGALATLLLMTVAATLLAVAALVRGLAARHRRLRAALAAQIARFVDNDAAPSFTTDSTGLVGYRNRAARDRFASADVEALTAVLGDLFANPAAVLHRLQSRAEATGAAREDLVTRRGHVRLA